LLPKVVKGDEDVSGVLELRLIKNNMRFSYMQYKKYIIDFKQVYIKHNININNHLYNKKTFPAVAGKVLNNDFLT
jgi:hypothetical protein